LVVKVLTGEGVCKKGPKRRGVKEEKGRDQAAVVNGDHKADKKKRLGNLAKKGRNARCPAKVAFAEVSRRQGSTGKKSGKKGGGGTNTPEKKSPKKRKLHGDSSKRRKLGEGTEDRKGQGGKGRNKGDKRKRL